MLNRKRVLKDASPKKPAGNELEDLNVERVDAVDNPATGSPFLILKAADSTELRDNTRTLILKARKALKRLAKTEGLALTDEAAAALNDLAETVELEDGAEMFEATEPTTKGKKPLNSGKLMPGMKSKAQPDPDEEEGDDEDGEEEVQASAAKPKAKASKKTKAEDAEDDGEDLADRIVAGVTKANAELLSGLTAALTGREVQLTKSAPRSKQSDEDDEPETRRPVAKKMGSGLFSDVVFGG